MENHELVTKALGYIDRSFRSGDMTIEAIAAKAGFSTDYFNRIFRAHTGFSVMEYVRFRRLAHGAHHGDPPRGSAVRSAHRHVR